MEKIKVNSYSQLLKVSTKKDIHILTPFRFYVKVTRKDIKESLGKDYNKYGFYLNVTNAVFIVNIWKL